MQNSEKIWSKTHKIPKPVSYIGYQGKKLISNVRNRLLAFR